MELLKLVNGNFYLDGKLIKPIIGDRELIELAKNAEREIVAAENKGIECDFEIIEVEVEVSFKCVCGEFVYDQTSTTYGGDDTAIDYYQDRRVKCKICERMYIIENEVAKLTSTI